jgi:cell division protein FtsL
MKTNPKFRMYMKNKDLHNIKSSGFKMPDNYLESFDERIFKKLETPNAISKGNASGFKVPKNYFEALDNQLIPKLSTKDQTKVVSLISWKKALYVSGIAASIVLMVALFNTYSYQPTFGDLEITNIEDYIADEDFTNEDLASLFAEDNLTLNAFMDSNLEDSNIEDYLLNNSSLEDLIEE